MAELTKEQKKEWAGMLYLKENLTQAEIAEKVGVSRQTIGKWIKIEKWEERKIGITLTREEILQDLYRQIKELNETIRARPKGQRFATPAEADTIRKLRKDIKELETEAGISDIISVAQRFVKFVRAVDLDKAKEITRLFDAFIKENL